MKDLTASYELTEEEKAAALQAAQDKKRELFEYEAKLERRRLWEETLRKPWGPGALLMYIRWRAERNGVPFVVDSDNHALTKLLCLYFTGDERFATEAAKLDQYGQSFSLEKGIMLCGPVGTGKTTLMNLFRGNQRRSYMVASCRQLADHFKSDGEVVLHRWSNPVAVPTHADTFFQNQVGVCFDDLGTEGAKRNFGDQVNVMADVLLNRYDYASVPFSWTHVTTNLTADEIETYYGARVRSRMREMFNMLTLGGEDRRK